MGLKSLLAVFAVSLLLGLLLWLPAALLVRQLTVPEGLALTQVQGTLWRGSTQVRVADQNINLHWQPAGGLRPLAWQLTVAGQGLSLAGELDLWQARLNDWTGQVDASFINQAMASHFYTQGTRLNGPLEVRGLSILSNWSLDPLGAHGRILSGTSQVEHTFFGLPQQVPVPLMDVILSTTPEQPGILVEVIDHEFETLTNARLYNDRTYSYEVYNRMLLSLGMPSQGNAEIGMQAERRGPLF